MFALISKANGKVIDRLEDWCYKLSLIVSIGCVSGTCGDVHVPTLHPAVVM